MTLPIWTKSNIDYTQKLVHSAVQGAHSGEEAFLQGEPLAQFLGSSVRVALRPAAIGAFLGILSGCSERRHPSKAVAYGFLGGAIGFSIGLAWESRRLAESVATSAWEKIGKVRDEHWFEKNPIDYA